MWNSRHIISRIQPVGLSITSLQWVIGKPQRSWLKKKKRTSEMMNRTIPYQSPFCLVGVWWPWEVLSQMMSYHHWYIMRTLVSRLSSNNTVELKWNHINHRPNVIKRAERTPVRGQGLGINMCMIGVGLVGHYALWCKYSLTNKHTGLNYGNSKFKNSK